MNLLTRHGLWPLLLCPALAMASPGEGEQTLPSAQHAHAAHAAHGAATSPKAVGTAARFQADAPLAQGMRRMAAIVEALDHGRHGHLGPVQVQKLAEGVNEAAATMFAECTLAPEPDAALHGLLARLMAGARALEQDPSDLAPLHAMEQAVATYPRLFNDPSFPR